MFYFLTSQLSTNHPTILSLRALYEPNQYLFLIMSPSTNTQSGHIISSETTTLATYPSTNYYVTHTELTTSITDLIAKLDNIEKSINNITATITDKDEILTKQLKKSYSL